MEYCHEKQSPVSLHQGGTFFRYQGGTLLRCHYYRNVPPEYWGHKGPIPSRYFRGVTLIEWEGKKYTISELAEKLGVTVPALKSRIRKGKPKELWGEKSRVSKVYNVNGKSFTLRQLCIKYNVPRNPLYIKLKKGIPVLEAVKQIREAEKKKTLPDFNTLGNPAQGMEKATDSEALKGLTEEQLATLQEFNAICSTARWD